MFLPFSLFGRSTSKSKKARPNAAERKARPPRLWLEELEDRAVPATYFVDITNPNLGTGTALDPFKYIQTAVQTANSNPGPDTIIIFGNNSSNPAHVYVWTREGDADGDGLADGDMLFSNQGIPNNDLTVIFRAQSLLVNPGAPAPIVVKMQHNIIDVDAGSLLRVEGQANARVIFTSYVDDEFGGDTNGDGSINLPNRADWGGIRYRAGAVNQGLNNSAVGALVNWANIRYTGASMFDVVTGFETEFAGIRMEANPTTGQFNQTRVWNTIFANGGRALDVNLLSMVGRGPDLGFNATGANGLGPQPLTFQNNTINGCFVFVPFDNNPLSPRFGQVVQLNADAQWDDVGVPYVLTNRVVLANGVTLTIDAGMVIKSQRVNIDAADLADSTNVTRGTISVNGRPEMPVIFTSLLDDNIFLPNTILNQFYNNGSADTNNDGSLTTPQPGDWGGLRVPNGNIDFAVVKYGGGLIPLVGQFINVPAVQIFCRDLTPSGGPVQFFRIANTEIAFTFTGSSFGTFYDSPALDIVANSLYFSFTNPRPEGLRDARMGDIVIIDNFIHSNQGKAIAVDPLAFHDRRNPFGGYGIHFRRNIIRDNALNGAYIQTFLTFLPDAILYKNLPPGGGYFDDTDIVLALDGQALAVFTDQTFQIMSRRGVEPTASNGSYIDRYQRTATQTDVQALNAFLTQGLVMRLPGTINIPLERGPVARNASLVDSGLFYYYVDFETTARNDNLPPNLQNDPNGVYLYGNEWRDWGVNFTTGTIQTLKPFYTRGNYATDPDPLGPPVSGTNMLSNANASGNGSMDLTFPNGVSAVGFWVIGNQSTSANEQIQFIAADGSVIDSMPLPVSAPGTNRSFVGRVSRTPIYRVRIIEDANDSAGGMFNYTGAPVAIGAGATVNVNLNVGAAFNLSRVGVGLNLTHNRVNDLIVSLRSPNGTVVQLANRPGGATGPAGANFTGTYFDDSGPVNIANGVPPYIGTYQPTSPLSAFNGQNVSGTWTLIIQNLGTTTGTLQNFSLNFQSASLAPDSIAIDDLYFVESAQSLVVKSMTTDSGFASGAVRGGFAGVQQNQGGAVIDGFVPDGTPYTITGSGVNARATGAGGAFRILGQSQNPVILTSILDATVGAGPIGTESFNKQTTDNPFSFGVPGSWTGIQIHPGTNFSKTVVVTQQPNGQLTQRYADINPYTLGDEGPSYLPGQSSYQDVLLTAGLHSLITTFTQTAAMVQDGALIEYADIRFARVAIEQRGYPDNKLTIEGNEIEQNRNNPNESNPANAVFQPMPGMMNRQGDGARVFETPSGAYRVGGRLGGFLESPATGTDDVDWFELPQAPAGSIYRAYIDVQRGIASGAGNDGPGGPVGIAVYNAQFQLLYWSGTTLPLVPFNVTGGASLANSGNALGPIVVRDEQDLLYDINTQIRDARYVAILPAGRRPSLFVPTNASPRGTFPQDNILVFTPLPAAGPAGSNGFLVSMTDQDGAPVAMPSDDFIWDPPGPSGAFLGGYEVEFRTEGFTNRSQRPVRAGDGELVIRNNMISSTLEAAIRLSDSRNFNPSNQNLGSNLPQQAARFSRDNATSVLNTNGVPFTNPANYVVGASIYNNLILNGLSAGITITEDTSQPAPNLFTPTGFITIANNTFDNNAGTSISVTSRGGTMIFNNIITNSSTALAYNKLPNIDATNPILAVFSYNLLFGNTTNITPGSQVNATQNLLNVNPQYVNPANLDYRLNVGSPAVDSAISEIADRLAAARFPQEPTRAPIADIRGRFRVDNPTRPNVGAGQFPFYDRGAYEVSEPVLRVVGLNVYTSNGLLSSAVSQIVVRFFGRVDPTTVNAATVRITQNSLTGPVIGIGTPSNFYDPLSNIHTFIIPLQTTLNSGVFFLQLKGTSTGPSSTRSPFALPRLLDWSGTTPTAI
jgi:subtilisin-like proprotein convertase family protein